MNFDEIVSGAKDLFNSAAAKAGEALDYSKAQLDRSKLKYKVKEKYSELGKICYDMHECGDDKTGEMKQLIGEIKELNEKIAKMEADASEDTKKVRYCSACGAVNNIESEYCAKCGEKL